MDHRAPYDRLGFGDVVGNAGADAVADEESRITALIRRQYRQRLRHMRAAAAGEHHTLGDLAGQRDHPLAQGCQDHRRQAADIVVGFEPADKGANVGERFAGCDPNPDMGRPVRDADAELEPSARELVDVGGRMRELLDGLCHQAVFFRQLLRREHRRLVGVLEEPRDALVRAAYDGHVIRSSRKCRRHPSRRTGR